MFGSCSRPIGRLFLLLPWLLATTVLAQAPPLTTVQDTVYRADGTPAQGTLLISWPAFTTANGQAVASGSTSTTLGAGGALSVALVANANASPVNSVYTVVYQTDLVKTEYWIVPTTSPATLAQVRTILGTSNASSQMVTQQYVNTAVASKANDSAVVHNSGDENIAGVKQFSSPPTLPAPVQPGDAVNKQYVDSAVQNNGNGSYLSTSGGTMTGALVLASDPSAPQQAADKHYTDMLAAVKADLISGLVPSLELGTGTPGASTCLLGNQTWGPCGTGGGSSSYINSILVANPNFNSVTPPAQSGFLNCSFQNASSNVSLECPYGASSSTFALGSQAVLNNQGNTYSSGVQDFSAASLKLPSGAGYMPAASGDIGYDTTASMPVINVNGITQQMALTTSNISGQASTALALATTPSQCNGSFATGIQADGNANCSVADILELAETSQPAGIPNYGIFWFDSTTHTPRIIDNNGQVAQLSLLNVFNSDANTLEEYNGTNPQEFNLYGTRTDGANFERLRLGYGIFGTSTYFFIGPDYQGTGQPRGLAFLTGSTPRWAIDSASVFKPWFANVYDIGTSTQMARNLYLGTSLVFGNGTNNGTLSGAHGTTNIAAEAGTLGTTAGAGLCNDGNGNITDSGCTSGAVGSVFGRSGVVTAQAGDYSVAQITGAAPLASPNFSGTPMAPTPPATDNSSKIATTAFVQGAVGIPNTAAAIGEPQTGASSSAVTPSPIYLDTSKFPGTTLGQHIKNCLIAGQGLNQAGIICDARGDIATVQDLDINPHNFTVSSGTVGSIKVYLPAGVITVEVPLVEIPGAPGADNAAFEGSIVWYGAGNSMGNTNSSNPTGTKLKAGPSFPTCASSSSIPGCNRLSAWSVTTIPYSDGNFNQQMYVQPVGAGAAFSASNLGEELIINPNVSANTSYGMITSIAAPGVGECPSGAVGACAVMAYVQGYQSAQSNVGFILKAPLTAVGAWPMSTQQSLGMYGMRFVDLSLDCNSVPGCDPAVNWYAAEKSGYSHDWLFNYTDIGLDVEGSHTQASDYEELIFTPPAGCDTNGNANLLAANFRNSGFRRLTNSTFVGANNCHPTYGLALDTAGAIVQGVHFEGYQNMVEIGVVPSCPIWCAPAYAIGGVSLIGVNGSCNNATCNSVLKIGTAVTVSNAWFEVMSAGSTANLPYTLIDGVNSQNLTSTNNPAVAWNLDGTGKVSWTDANPVDLTANGRVAFDLYNGVANFGGAVTLPNGSVASTQSAGDNSIKVATDQFVQSSFPTDWFSNTMAGNTGAYPSSSANKCLMWGMVLQYPITTTQITYYVGANPDNTSSYSYDLGLYNSSGQLKLSLNGGTLHGNTFAPSTGSQTLAWSQGSTTLAPGRYYLCYYSSNTGATPPTLQGINGSGVTFYKNESGSGGAQGSGGFSITPGSGGTLPSSISAPGVLASWGAYMPTIWIH